MPKITTAELLASYRDELLSKGFPEEEVTSLVRLVAAGHSPGDVHIEVMAAEVPTSPVDKITITDPNFSATTTNLVSQVTPNLEQQVRRVVRDEIRRGSLDVREEE